MEVLGIDIGGTGIKGAIVDTETGQLTSDRMRLLTPQPATPESVINTVNQLVKEFNWTGIIGCGFPAAVQHDVVRTASNIDKSWIGLNAGKEIENATGCKTHLVNDVDAAGYAEMTFGAGKDHKGSVIMLAAGTGIGSAMFTNGALYPNSELGWIKVKKMPAEHYAANSVREREDLTWEEWAKRFNRYLKRVEKLFWPDLFILGGGVSKKYDKYSKYFNNDTKVVPAQTKNHAGIIGAALAAREHFHA